MCLHLPTWFSAVAQEVSESDSTTAAAAASEEGALDSLCMS